MTVVKVQTILNVIAQSVFCYNFYQKIIHFILDWLASTEITYSLKKKSQKILLLLLKKIKTFLFGSNSLDLIRNPKCD